MESKERQLIGYFCRKTTTNMVTTRGQLPRCRSGAVRGYQHISLGYGHCKRRSRVEEIRESTPPADMLDESLYEFDMDIISTLDGNETDDSSGQNTIHDDRKELVVYDGGTSANKALESPPIYQDTISEEVSERRPENRLERGESSRGASGQLEPSTHENQFWAVLDRGPSQISTTTLSKDEFNQVARNRANADKTISAVEPPDPFCEVCGKWPKEEKIPQGQRMKYYELGVRIGYNMALDGIRCNHLRNEPK